MFKPALITLISAVSILPAQTTAPKKKPETKTAAAPAALTIPANATQNADGTWSYTDKQGKKWIYRKSPFGLSRTEDTGAAVIAPPTTASFTSVTESGDTVTFTRKTPFGNIKWEKKKSDLTEEERALLTPQTAKPTADPQ